MCRNIKPLFNFDPPATSEEIHDASLQYVRKLTGMNKPSPLNEDAFEQAIEEVANATQKLFHSLITNAKPKDREVEREKARLRNIKRFGER